MSSDLSKMIYHPALFIMIFAYFGLVYFHIFPFNLGIILILGIFVGHFFISNYINKPHFKRTFRHGSVSLSIMIYLFFGEPLNNLIATIILLILFALNIWYFVHSSKHNSPETIENSEKVLFLSKFKSFFK